MMRIQRVLRENQGIARRATLERAGVRRRELEQAIDEGAVMRLRKGLYALPDVDREILAAARHGGELACSSALRAHCVWVLTDEPASRDDGGPGGDPHVWIGPSGREHRHPGCTCRVHHEEGDRLPGFGVVGILLALIQYAVCATDERFFASLESALRLGVIADAGVRLLRSRLPRTKRWIVDLAGTKADSGLESLLRFRLYLRGISVQSQVWIEGVGRVDFLLGGRIILEVDGRENHEGQSLRHKDLMRDAAAAALGYETLRFDYAMIVYNWERVLSAILGRLQAVDPAVAQEVSANVQEQTLHSAAHGLVDT